MSPLLALECSSSRSSWALIDGTSTLTEAHTTGRASGALFATLSTGWPTGVVPARILVGVGPGSFSGIRVAIAAAMGLARGWNCPVIPVRSTHAMARRHTDVSLLGLFSDAKRGQYFYTTYEFGRMTCPSRLIARDELGTYVSQCSMALSPDPLDGVPLSEYPDAAELARAWLEWGTEPELALEPIYLHDTVVPIARPLGPSTGR